jgi:hypothetical protein
MTSDRQGIYVVTRVGKPYAHGIRLGKNVPQNGSQRRTCDGNLDTVYTGYGHDILPRWPPSMSRGSSKSPGRSSRRTSPSGSRVPVHERA